MNIERLSSDFKSEVSLGKPHQVILQHGEVTGHHHLLQSDSPILEVDTMVKDYKGTDVFLAALELEGESVITHHEHWSQVYPKGRYVKSIQVAYNPWDRKFNPVMD